MKKYGFLLGVLLLLTACPSVPPEAQLSTFCDAVRTAYKSAAGYKAQGKLSATQISTLTNAEPVLRKACDPMNPPTDIPTAITSATQALADAQSAIAGVK